MKYTKRTFLAVSIIIFICIISAGIYKFVNSGSKLPFDNKVKTITIIQEVEPYSTKVENVDEFINKMDTGKWEKINRFELKSAPVAYLKIEPSGDMVEIYSPDDNNGYCRVDKSYYKIPTEVYDYIMSKIK